MKTHNLLKGIFFVLCSIIFSWNSYAASSNETLVHYVYMGEFSKDTARIALNKMPPLDTLEVHHNLQLYKINYKTPDPDGNLTIASGLVAMPVSPSKKVAIVSYQHGTRFERNDVPSRNNEKNYMYLAAFGNSAGYMIAMPDYLGLGDNELPIHPYVQGETLASSSVNMLIAAKELAQVLNYPVSDKLYLAGYSEGGFSTNVMFELLVNQYPSLPVTAVASGSAPYDWDETMRFIMLDPGPRATAYLAYFFYTLQTYSHYWTDFNEIFAPPYNTLIPVLFDGNHTVPEILQALPLNPQLILQPTFFSGIINQTDEHIDVLKANFNHYDFVPNAPFLMIGTKGDHDVPYHGAEIAYEIFSQHSDQVYIKSISDTLDHVQAHPYVLKEQVEFFKRFDD
ncbi:alpha/beta hydrolase family protein [Legionella quateirensis]|uniref:Secreted protein n=1 Tax=Legionella quateirensis TaxID=45072 RepID=A0A378KUN8_9GAMM|nr:hypothetical protein [Legionella quateirensis]KTD43390.1 secreted protein [Legionella quateirensis]STY18273.1 secreted protein [Legionella quateirensis]